MAKNSKHRDARAEPDLDAPDMASPDPWRRFPKGARLAREIERGREQEALWLLADGSVPTMALMERALCSAAHQGMALLCSALADKGASGRARAAPKSCLRDEEHGLAFEERHGPAMLALLSGHAKLASWLVARLGRDAFGGGGALDYARIASEASLARADRPAALEMARAGMDAKALAKAGNLLALSGSLDAALELLEAAGPLEAGAVARAMIPPLCAYPECDPMWEPALVVLSRAVELCEGATERAVAPWTPCDHEAMRERSYWRPSGESARAREVWELARRGRSWDACFSRKAGAVFPRVAAAMAGNARAMELLSGVPWSGQELSELRSCAGLACAAHEGALAPSALPNLFGKAELGRAGKGFDALAWARAAAALAESMDLEEVVRQGDLRRGKRAKKEAKAGRGAGAPDPQPAPGPPRARRL